MYVMAFIAKQIQFSFAHVPQISTTVALSVRLQNDGYVKEQIRPYNRTHNDNLPTNSLELHSLAPRPRFPSC